MAYEKQTWVDYIIAADTNEVLKVGTPISAARLNHMEEGIANVTSSLDTLSVGSEGTTFQDIKDSLSDVVESKVEKEEGKGLSSNDFTDDLKTKLEGQLTPAQITSLLERIASLETWKANVLAGSTSVLVDQT